MPAIRRKREIRPPGSGVLSDARRVPSASKNGTPALWDAAAKEVGRFRAHTAGIVAAAFAPDGKQALSNGADGTTRLWDVATAKELRVLKGHSAAISGVALSPDGKRVVTGNNDQTVRPWDMMAVT